MFKGNLLKANWSTVKQDDVLVIDSNSRLEQRMKEAQTAMMVRDTEEIPVEMVDGMDAFTVAGLLEDAEDVTEQFTQRDAEMQAQEMQEFRPASNIIKASQPYNGPTLDEVDRQIREKLAEAEEQAAAILADAEQKADGIRRAAHEQGKKSGYDEGYASGLAKMLEKEEQLKVKAKQLEQEYERMVEELEPQFVDALTDIYEHVFDVELKEHRGILVHLISGAIRKSEGNKDFLVHVSKDDYPYVSMQKKLVQESVVTPNASVEIIEDLTLTRGQCMIETGGGIFDCGLGTELKELATRLKLLSYEKKEQK